MGSQTGVKKTTYSVLSSGILHAGIAVAILTMQVSSPEPAKPELVEIQIQETKRNPLLLSPKEMQAAPSSAAAAPAPVKASSTPLPVTSLKTAKSSSRPAPSPIMNDGETETELEKSLMAPVAFAEPQLNDSDVDEGIEKARQQSTAEVPSTDLPEVDSVIEESEILAQQARKHETDRSAEMAKAASLRHSRELSELQKSKALKAQALAAEQARLKEEALQKEQSQALARALARAKVQAHDQATQAAAAKAAREAADEDRRQQETLAASEEAETEAQAQAAAEEGQGQPGSADAGTIRSLEDLKQMPGNRRPQYDTDDRLAGRTGDVIFKAFVTKEGTPTQILKVHSSGHQTLDDKTYNAIRGWRFYPGQEGWVEIPFRWDLKGEPQPIGGTLRKVSQK